MINDGDKVIRDHIGSMEAGSENIIFDKEAAWGRLHERMAAKVPKTIFKLPYRWAAAAAILLLVATAIAVMNRPQEKQVATTIKKAAPVSLPQNNAVAPQSRETLMTVSNTPIPKHIVQKETRIINTIEPQAPETQVVKEEMVNIIPGEKKEIIAAAPKMKVVHINEVMEDERMEQRMLSTRYAGGRSFFLFKPVMGTGYTEERNSDKPHNPFKISLSTQN